ncbi:uncharacterized protein LOC108734097 isoform X2 [Agrilus planipennis]|uniref:Uncharacterized protein LOC108734097 isoform X2 n=1 Tax=Agrilus planipennis TaxID=224129 RepID=A0A1W4WLS2_AGRPL|nr:uncharacterized protein LOC108734097 isoform X2 [Agrilus planipennis]
MFYTDLDSQNQILERVQSDRVTLTKPEEDRRRRTIIVEKKNGSYGFTLQSYGIHYKKEQEIEMITYVDYVDYDGPAYRAGMREGDVILSINGTDMEKADHKTLVNFIKNCDSRMRMVVLFEDCVRKVELHMRYIQLQRILQSKMTELEKLCIRERQLLEGKWKTHSLPARKKASHATDTGDLVTPTQPQYLYCRPTVSTEDVAKIQQKQPPPQTAMLAYQYLDPRYQYVLQPSSGSGEYLLSFKPPRYQSEQQHFLVKTPCDSTQKYNKANQTDSTNTKIKKSFDTCHSYVCNPCIQGNNNGDNASLEAYDLASPCCDPHCVPNPRRRSRNHKEVRKRDSRTEETQTQTEDTQQKPRVQTQYAQAQYPGTHQQISGPRRYLQFGAGLVSQCSLHSCTSSEISGIAPTTTGESTASYSTSLSTDTLYWDGSGDMGSKQPSVKSSTKHDYQRYPSSTTHSYESAYPQYPPVKPKSWDNLATKAFGGYGFGYGYLDTTKCSKPAQKTYSTKMTVSQAPQYFRVCTEKCTITSSCSNQSSSMYGNCSSQRRYIPPTKSTESLLSVPKYSNEILSDSNISCDCVDPSISPGPMSVEGRFFQSPRQSVISPTDPNMGYYSTRRMTRGDLQRVSISTSSEATRL